MSRGLSSTVGLVTGHEATDKAGSAVNWESLSRAVDTLVILMGLRNLPAIVERLLKAGKSPDTPVAVVCQGSLPEQVTLVSRLGQVVEEVEAHGLQPPAIIVVGEVVRLRERICWLEEPGGAVREVGREALVDHVQIPPIVRNSET